MKQRIQVVLIAIISVIVLYLIGYVMLLPGKQHNTAMRYVDNAAKLYDAATLKTELSTDTKLTIQLTEEMNVDGTVFKDVSYRTVYYDMQTSGETYIQTQETRHSGTQTIEISEIFANDVIYLTINDAPFSSSCDAEQYKNFQIPAIILTRNLYSDITGIDTGAGYTVTFSEATSAEEWLTNPSADFLEAKGIAQIDYNGNLISSIYSASYLINDILFNITAEVAISKENTNVLLPDSPSSYTQISDWQAPKLLERACGYLLQAKQISSFYNDSIYFEAIGDYREKHVEIHADFNDSWSVLVSTDITTKNETKLDQSQTLKRTEIFLEEQYRISSNKEAFVINNTITVDTMYNYFQDQLVSTIMLPQHIRSAEIIKENDILHIVFYGTEAFGSFLVENACKLLYDDPDLITETGSEFITTQLKCYIDIYNTTGIPLASGIDYTGSYTAEGLPYSLGYRADQSYSIPSPNAIAEIEKAAD